MFALYIYGSDYVAWNGDIFGVCVCLSYLEIHYKLIYLNKYTMGLNKGSIKVTSTPLLHVSFWVEDSRSSLSSLHLIIIRAHRRLFRAVPHCMNAWNRLLF